MRLFILQVALTSISWCTTWETETPPQCLTKYKVNHRARFLFPHRDCAFKPLLDDIFAGTPAVPPSQWGGQKKNNKKRKKNLPYRASLSIIVLSCLNRVKIRDLHMKAEKAITVIDRRSKHYAKRGTMYTICSHKKQTQLRRYTAALCSCHLHNGEDCSRRSVTV